MLEREKTDLKGLEMINTIHYILLNREIESSLFEIKFYTKFWEIFTFRLIVTHNSSVKRDN